MCGQSSISQTSLSLCLGFSGREGDFATNLAEIGRRDVEERRNILQRQLLHDLWAALQQQLIALAAVGTVETDHPAVSLKEKLLHD